MMEGEEKKKKKMKMKDQPTCVIVSKEDIFSFDVPVYDVMLMLMTKLMKQRQDVEREEENGMP